jgi:hypothetical protein
MFPLSFALLDGSFVFLDMGPSVLFLVFLLLFLGALVYLWLVGGFMSKVFIKFFNQISCPTSWLWINNKIPLGPLEPAPTLHLRVGYLHLFKWLHLPLKMLCLDSGALPSWVELWPLKWKSLIWIKRNWNYLFIAKDRVKGLWV